MALIVQKYGGTSVGSIERIQSVARRVAKWRNAGNDVVVVVSAMSGETNRLIDLAHSVSAHPDPRELDVTCDTQGDLETGWCVIDSIGVRTPGGYLLDNDGAVVGAISAGYESKISGGRLLWGSKRKQSNGSFGAGVSNGL